VLVGAEAESSRVRDGGSDATMPPTTIESEPFQVQTLESVAQQLHNVQRAGHVQVVSPSKRGIGRSV
jgi:hypothetical protein